MLLLLAMPGAKAVKGMHIRHQPDVTISLQKPALKSSVETAALDPAQGMKRRMSIVSVFNSYVVCRNLALRLCDFFCHLFLRSI